MSYSSVYTFSCNAYIRFAQTVHNRGLMNTIRWAQWRKLIMNNRIHIIRIWILQMYTYYLKRMFKSFSLFVSHRAGFSVIIWEEGLYILGESLLLPSFPKRRHILTHFDLQPEATTFPIPCDPALVSRVTSVCYVAM